MSYSRWGKNSRWYTFWAATSSNVRSEQSFEICGDGISITYGLLKQYGVNVFLEHVRDKTGCTDEELSDLQVSVEAFMKDVSRAVELTD